MKSVLHELTCCHIILTFRTGEVVANTQQPDWLDELIGVVRRLCPESEKDQLDGAPRKARNLGRVSPDAELGSQDGSGQALLVTDPTNRRSDAMRRVLKRYKAAGPAPHFLAQADPGQARKLIWAGVGWPPLSGSVRLPGVV